MLSWDDTLKTVTVDLTRPNSSAYGLAVTTTAEGSHTHSFQYTKATGLGDETWTTGTTAQNTDSSVTKHTHGYKKQKLTTETTTAETKSSTTHTHNVTIPAAYLVDSASVKISGIDHTHTIDVSHNHDLIYGIYEGASPTDVAIYYDNGNGYDSGESLGTFTEITDKVLVGDNVQKFTGSGWKAIKFTSSTLGRLRVQMMIELRVDTTE